MGEIKDAIETIADVKAELANAGVFQVKRSISASAMEGTANFPVLVEDSISLDDGILVSRAAEKKYASFLLTVLTMDPFLEVEKGKVPTASEYLKQFHQNMRVKDADKGFALNLVDFAKESYTNTDMDYSIMESEAFKMAYAIYEGVARSVPQDKNIRLNYTIEDVTTMENLNSKFFMGVPSMEANRRFDNVRTDVNGGANINSMTSYVNGRNTHVNADTANVQRVNNLRMGDNNVNATVGNINNRSNASVGDINIKVGGGDSRSYNKELPQKSLTDNDCKKANDLVPTLLHIRIYPVDKYTREELSPIDFIMGVKATLHSIPMTELCRMVVTGMRNENFMFNFVRWTTGEIKFFKDFVFAIDTLKMDAKDAGKDVTGWRPALKRRRNLSKSKLRLSKNSIVPNATLVVSQAAIDYIRETYGYDLSDERIVNRMMSVYFLLGFVSVNTVSQRASFKFDGIEYTDTYTFDTLKRESQNDDKAFKNMMKMLGRSM